MATDTPLGLLELFSDFLDDNATLTETVASSATQDVMTLHGGWIRQTLAGDDGDATLIAGERAFEIDEGGTTSFEVRLKTSDSSKSGIFVGFTDNNAESGGVVYENEDGTINSVATDLVGFLLEGEQDETWNGVGTQNDTNNTAQALTGSTDAADATIQTLRMELNANDSGTARYYVDGALESTKTSWFRSSIVYAPCVSSDDRGTAYTTDIDYIYTSSGRS